MRGMYHQMCKRYRLLWGWLHLIPNKHQLKRLAALV